jgi:hypothetical protein
VRRLRGVDVLRTGGLVVVEPARAEADGAAALVADRDHEPSAEEVVGPPVVARAHEADRGGDGEVDVRRAQRLDEGLSARGRVADPEVRARRLGEAAIAEVAAGPRALGRPELPLEVLDGALEDVALGVGRFPLAVRLLRAAAPARELDTRPRREDLERVQEGEVVHPLQEGDLVPAGRAGPEAVPGPPTGIDAEGGGPLLVEGAAGGVTAPGFLEARHPLADHVLDGGSKLDGLDRSAERFVVHGGTGGQGRWGRPQGRWSPPT